MEKQDLEWMKSEIRRLVDKFTDEKGILKINDILFERPKEKNEEWSRHRGNYNRKEHKIYISLEKRARSLIFLTLAHELAHVLSPSDIFHNYWFWDIMDKITLPFVKRNLQLEKDRISLEKLENPTTNEDGEWTEVYLEPRKGMITLSIEREKMNETWKLIKEETLKGNLGTNTYGMTAKKKAEINSEKYWIFIYTKDIKDKKDIARILERLLELGFNEFTIKER